MRRILTLTLLSLGLSSGVALADDRHNDEHHGDRDRGHDRDRRTDEGHRYDRGRTYYGGRVHYRDYRYRPPYRYERFYDRPGYRWRTGEWIWNGFEWIWRPGYYIRITL